MPATTSHNSCRCVYRPSGPHGTSLYRSDFYGEIVLLDRLDWDGINKKRFIDDLEEYKRIRHAEVLVPDLLPLSRVHGIFVSTQNMVQDVNAVIAECGLTGRIPPAVYKPNLFFP